jgi:inosose dehydratase
MYVPLGEGDVDIRAIVRGLIQSGYQGWFTLEQDNVINSEPPAGGGPLDNARKSVAFIRAVAEELAAE